MARDWLLLSDAAASVRGKLQPLSAPESISVGERTLSDSAGLPSSYEAQKAYTNCQKQANETKKNPETEAGQNQKRAPVSPRSRYSSPHTPWADECSSLPRADVAVPDSSSRQAAEKGISGLRRGAAISGQTETGGRQRGDVATGNGGAAKQCLTHTRT